MRLLLLAGLLLGSSAPPSVEVLAPGRYRENVAGGETRVYALEAAADHWIEVTVAAEDRPVIVRWTGPGGAPVLQSTVWEYFVESTSIITGSPGRYTLTVSGETGATSAAYTVTAGAPRPATPETRDRLAAQEALREGRGLVFTHLDENIRKGLVFLERAVRLWRGAGDAVSAAEAQMDIAQAYLFLNDPQKATTLHAEALPVLKASPGRPTYNRALLFAAEGHMAARQLARAVEAYEESLAVSRALGARRFEGMALTNLAKAYAEIGDTGMSLRSAQAAIPVLRALGLREGEAANLQHVARAHHYRGEFGEAVEAMLQSLRIIEDLPEAHWRRASSLAFLGAIYAAQGDSEAALQYLEKAYRSFTPQAIHRPGQATTLDALATVYERLGNRDRALAFHAESVELRRQAGDRWSLGRALLNVARFHASGGRADHAMASAQEALALLRDTGDPREVARVLEVLGRAALARGDPARAEAALQEALDIHRAIGNDVGIASSLQALAAADRTRGMSALARKRLEEALGVVDRQRARIVSPDVRASWVALVRSVHEDHVSVLMDLHRATPEAGFDVRAFEASEAARARSLLDLVSEPGVAADPDVPVDLLEQRQSIRDRLAHALDQQVRPVARTDGGAEKQEEVQRLTTELDRVESLIRRAGGRAGAEIAVPLSLPEVRARVLDDDTLLLQYALGETRSYLWTVGRGVFQARELPPRAVIEAAAREAQAALARRPEGDTRSRVPLALGHLAVLILPPETERLPTRRLLVAADGALHHVPFAALPRSGRPLLGSHEIVNIPSASVVAALGAERRGRPPAPKTLAVLADPVFDGRDERVKGRRGGEARPDHLLESATRGAGLDRLGRLPFTRREGLQILALAPPAGRRAAFDFEASRRTVLQGDLSEYRFVHFATHGLVNGARPDMSGVVLSLVDAEGRETPGFLAAPEVFGLELNADLVVLSGCATALGRQVNGEGLLGLTRAFLYAGARGVVGSLWRVDDLATAELMTRFYEGMLGPRRLGPAAALRTAQLSLSADHRWREPYYWAGFQVQGESE